MSALASRKRLHILMLLAASDIVMPSSGSLSFSSLVRHLGIDKKDRPVLVHHLKELQEANLVVKRTAPQPGHPETYRVYKLTDLGWKALENHLRLTRESFKTTAKSLLTAQT
jgi:DNA-binding transcriptional ArsR family regulator